LESRGRLRPLVRAVTERLNDLVRIARRRGSRSWGASVGGEALARGGGLPSVGRDVGGRPVENPFQGGISSTPCQGAVAEELG